ncbi:hypothetical protein CU044_0949 [Streptomyces sp. L-9-10]|nr:hypothetical protein CU044_0949 [Streptomyces sp. L-9-10]
MASSALRPGRGGSGKPGTPVLVTVAGGGHRRTTAARPAASRRHPPDGRGT